MNFLLYILLFMSAPIIMTVAWVMITRNNGWRSRVNLKEAAINIVACIIIASGVYGFSYYSDVSDVEILNGSVTGKERDHGTYTRSYSCNCSTSCSGTGSSRSCREVCQTCYETRYTVDWYIYTTVGTITVDSLDSSSSWVYDEPDPKVYAGAVKGEPASLEHRFTNYVKVSPGSLFNTMTDKDPYMDDVPGYPRVYGRYKINRVLGLPGQEGKELNTKLCESLKTLGASKQANIIVIATTNPDPSFRHSVENKWLGGKKNDIVVFLGHNASNLVWVDVMTWALNSGNETMAATMKSELMDIETIDPTQIHDVIVSNVNKYYDRPQMVDYEYLKDDHSPSTRSIIIGFMLCFIVSGVLLFVFHRNEI